jgi:hypothetical protein
MMSRRIAALPLLGGCMLAAVSCTELVGAIAARASEPEPAPRPAPPPRAPVYYPPPPPPPPPVAAPPPVVDHVIVASLAVGEYGVEVGGIAPPPRIDPAMPPAARRLVLPVLASWCLLDQVGSGLCAFDPDGSPGDTAGGPFHYVISRRPVEMEPVVRVRRPGTVVPDSQEISVYLRVSWFVASDVEVQPVVTRARGVGIVPDAGGWALAPLLSGIECFRPASGEWLACSEFPAPNASLLIRIDAGADALLGSIKEAVDPIVFYGAFPTMPGACDQLLADVRRAADTVDAAVAAAIPETRAAAAEAAAALFQAWQAEGGASQRLDPAAATRCGWPDLSYERALAVYGRLLDLLREAAILIELEDLDRWAAGACIESPDLCDAFAAIGDEQAALEDAVDELESSAQRVLARCEVCAEGVAYDNRGLMYDCEDNFIDEACRRLQRIVDNRCTSQCSSWNRCKECLGDLGDGLDSGAAPRLAAEQCARACR